MSGSTSIQGHMKAYQPLRWSFQGRLAGGGSYPEGIQVESWSCLVAVDFDVHKPVLSTQLTCD